MLDRPVRAGQIRPTGTPRKDAGPIVTRRRGRPGPKPVVGALLIATAAVVVFVAALSAAGGKRTLYVIAARPMAAGTVIGPGDTTTAKLVLNGASGSLAFRQPAVVIGRALAVPVDAGELIQSSALTPVGGAQLRPVSIPVDANSVSELQAGDPVDALSVATAANGGSAGNAPPVTVVVRGATLLAVERSGGGLLSGDTGGTVIATLGVADLSEAEQLVAASHSGTVDLVRAELADGTGPGSGP